MRQAMNAHYLKYRDRYKDKQIVSHRLWRAEQKRKAVDLPARIEAIGKREDARGRLACPINGELLQVKGALKGHKVG